MRPQPRASMSSSGVGGVGGVGVIAQHHIRKPRASAPASTATTTAATATSASPQSSSLIVDRPKRGDHRTQKAIEGDEQEARYRRKPRPSGSASPQTPSRRRVQVQVQVRVSERERKRSRSEEISDEEEEEEDEQETKPPSVLAPATLSTSASPSTSPPKPRFVRKRGTVETMLRWCSPPGSTADIDEDNIITGGRGARRTSQLLARIQGDESKPTASAKSAPLQRRASEPARKAVDAMPPPSRVTRGRVSALAATPSASTSSSAHTATKVIRGRASALASSSTIPHPALSSSPTATARAPAAPAHSRRASQRTVSAIAPPPPSTSDSSGLSSPLLEITDSSDDEAPSSDPVPTASTSRAVAAPTAKSMGKKRAALVPKWKRKVFLTAGLYSPDFKIDGSNGAIRNGRLSARGVLEPISEPAFPEPVHFGRDLLTGTREFSLPPPLLEQSSALRARLDAKRKPPPYRQIDRNRYTSRPKLNGELPLCQCDPSSNCGDDCLNRILQFVCNPKVCPCGERCTNVSLGKRPRARCDVAWYGERGFGLKTLDAIKEGGLVDEYRGEVINLAEAARRVNEYYKDAGNFYFLDYDAAAGEVLDGGLRGNITRFANHSCNPNCYIEKWLVCGTDEERTAEFQVGLFALRDIAPGEELTYDYGWSAFANMGKQVAAAAPAPVIKERCYCGAPNCCGVLGGKKGQNANGSSGPASSASSPAPAARSTSSSSSSLAKRTTAKKLIHAKKSTASRAAQQSSLAAAAAGQKATTTTKGSAAPKRTRAELDATPGPSESRPRRSLQPTSQEPVVLTNSPPRKRVRTEADESAEREQYGQQQQGKGAKSATTSREKVPRTNGVAGTGKTNGTAGASIATTSKPTNSSANATTPALPAIAAPLAPPAIPSLRARRGAPIDTTLASNVLSSVAASAQNRASTSSTSTASSSAPSSSKPRHANGLPAMPGPLSSDAAGRLLAQALGGRFAAREADTSWVTVDDGENSEELNELASDLNTDGEADDIEVVVQPVLTNNGSANAARRSSRRQKPRRSYVDDSDVDELADGEGNAQSRLDKGKGAEITTGKLSRTRKVPYVARRRMQPMSIRLSSAPAPRFQSKPLGPGGIPLWPLGKPDIGKDGQPVRYNPANREARGAIRVGDYPPGTKFFLADGRPIDARDVDEASKHRYVYSGAELEEKARMRRDKNAESARIRRLRKKHEEDAMARGISLTPMSGSASGSGSGRGSASGSASVTPGLTAHERERQEEEEVRDELAVVKGDAEEWEDADESRENGSRSRSRSKSRSAAQAGGKVRPGSAKAASRGTAASTAPAKANSNGAVKPGRKSAANSGASDGNGVAAAAKKTAKKAKKPTSAATSASPPSASLFAAGSPPAINGAHATTTNGHKTGAANGVPASNGSSAHPNGPHSAAAAAANGRTSASSTRRKIVPTAKAKDRALNGGGANGILPAGAASAAFRSAAAKAGSATRFTSRSEH